MKEDNLDRMILLDLFPELMTAKIEELQTLSNTSCPEITKYLDSLINLYENRWLCSKNLIYALRKEICKLLEDAKND